VLDHAFDADEEEAAILAEIPSDVDMEDPEDDRKPVL